MSPSSEVALTVIAVAMLVQTTALVVGVIMAARAAATLSDIGAAHRLALEGSLKRTRAQVRVATHAVSHLSGQAASVGEHGLALAHALSPLVAARLPLLAGVVSVVGKVAAYRR
ncbi:MAG: hypothetical protein ABI880_03850, partial [Acidobacteriota bacterium]